MNIRDYIAGGIIEKYVMGLATREEREEFEQLCLQHPDLEEARIEFEQLLETRAMEGAQQPPEYVKEKIFEAIRQARSSPGTIVEMDPPVLRPPKIRGMSWAIAASVILVAGCLGLIWFFYQKNEQIRQEMTTVENTIDTLDQQQQLIIEQLKKRDRGVKHVQIENADKNIPATINVFWDSTSTDVYLVINNLAPLPGGQAYQVWAFTKGKAKSLGLFDAPTTDRLILKMPGVQQADSFSITIDKKGIRTSPVDDTIR